MLLDAYCFIYRVKLSEQITCESYEMRNEEMTEMGGFIFFF